jgi:putative ABC transport system substrate-binding protein
MTGAGPDDPLVKALHKGLKDAGYVEGQNIKLEFRSARLHPERAPRLAEELVQLKPDVIVAGAETAINAAKQATQTIPIVMVIFDDPRSAGLIKSISQPGQNITGIFTRQPELTGKRLELLREIVPGVSRVAVLLDGFSKNEIDEVKPAADALGVETIFQELHPPYDFNATLKMSKRQRAGAVLALYSSTFYINRDQLAEAALRNHLPLTGYAHELTRAGGLFSYGPDLRDTYYRAAYFVDRLLKGAKPSDLPIEQPTKFLLVVNERTAKVLGVKIPESVLVRADEILR